MNIVHIHPSSPTHRRTLIAFIITSILSSYCAVAASTEYNIAITGSEQGYEAIKTTTPDGKIIYDFRDGDSVVLSKNESAVRAGSQTDIEITSPITISNANQSASGSVVYSRSLYAYLGQISADDLNLDTTSVTAVNNGWAVAIGVDATGGSIRTENISGHIVASAEQGSHVGILQAQGLKVASANASIDIQGNAKFTLEAINDDSAGTATNVAGAVVQDGNANTPNKLNIAGILDVTGTSTFTASGSGSYILASAIAAYDGADITAGSLNANLTSTIYGADAIAQSFGVLTTPSRGNGVAVINVGDTEIRVQAEGKAGADALTGGVWLENASHVSIGRGNIHSEAKSESGTADAFGLYVAQGTLDKENGDISVVSDGTAYGIYAIENGTVNYDGGAISVAGSETSHEAGIFTQSGAVVNLRGDTTISAGNALVGNGTVNVLQKQNVIFDGSSESFTGILNIKGNSTIGLSATETSGYWQDSEKAQLILPAGIHINGIYTVGTSAEGVIGDSSLTLLADSILTILVVNKVDNTESLITANEFDLNRNASINIINSIAAADGTIVFDGKLNSLDQQITTDNVLVTVIDNKISRVSSSRVLGKDFLIPNVVDGALGTTTEAGLLIDQLTHASADLASSKNTLNGVALTGIASGMQTTALNASALVSESILRRTEQRSQDCLERGGLWVDLSGLSSRADSYRANSATFGFKSDLVGLTLGVDYGLGDDFIIGAAFSAGTGSVRGQGSASGIKNDVDYWGFNLYGVLASDYVDLIGTLGYAHVSNDINYLANSASPKVQTYTMSIRAEKSLPLNKTFSVTPHIGVQWSHLETDEFTTGGFTYDVKNSDVVQIPAGATFSGHSDTGNFIVKPYLDLEVAPTFGDKTNDYKVGFIGGSAQDLIDARITGSVVWSARLGITAFSDAHAFSLRYGVHASNGDRVDQNLTANYRFTF